MYIHNRVDFFYRLNGIEGVYNGEVVGESGKFLVVEWKGMLLDITTDDLVDQDNHGFSDEVVEPIHKWYGED